MVQLPGESRAWQCKKEHLVCTAGRYASLAFLQQNSETLGSRGPLRTPVFQAHFF